MGTRVGIIGAGPAGAACALRLLHGARTRRQSISVLLFDGKSFQRVGPRGCNMCAGVISMSVLDELAKLGAQISPALVQREVTGFSLETQSGAVRIPKDPNAHICTVFRSAGPRGDEPASEQSFDNLLLQTALSAGAIHIGEMVRHVRLPEMPDGPFRLQTADGDVHYVDVLVGAFGVNSNLAGQFEQLGFGYRPPEAYHVSQAELPFDKAYIEEHWHGEIKIFSLGLPGIRFGALTPKRRHVTATVIGPKVMRDDLLRFLAHPRVRGCFPAEWTPPKVFCQCHPRLPVTAARNPVADRLICIGDAHISRYLKGGIESSLFTGALAAEAILAGKLSRAELWQSYVRPCQAKYLYDNVYGRFLFRWNDVISRMPPVARAALRIVACEQWRYPRWEDRCHTQLLWHLFAGDAPYRQIMLEALGWRSILIGIGMLLQRSEACSEVVLREKDHAEKL